MDKELIFVKPAQGRTVLAPNGKKIEGIVKVDAKHPYWIRCLRSGDLKEISKETAEKSAGAKTIPQNKEGEKTQ